MRQSDTSILRTHASGMRECNLESVTPRRCRSTQHPFDAVVSGLVLNFVPDPRKATAEMRRAARPGGVVAAYVWDYAGKMELMRYFWDAAAELSPKAKDLDEGKRFQICKPERLEALLNDVGLHSVETTAIDVPTLFRDFNDYWSPFLGGQGSAPGYTMALTEAERAALRELLHRLLPVRADGSIHLLARAWGVKALASVAPHAFRSGQLFKFESGDDLGAHTDAAAGKQALINL